MSSHTSKATQWSAAGWFVLRLGIGITFLFLHGGPKLLGGPETWVKLGGAMGSLGISFAPVFWGFCAALAEALGGLLLILGLFVRPAAVFMLITMFVAVVFHAQNGESIAHPLEMAIVFAALIVSGGGPWRVTRLFGGGRTQEQAPNE